MNTNNTEATAYKAGRYVSIDIGTVTCRMLIADVDADGHLSEVDREYAITNLGEGVDATGVLKSEAIERTIAAIAGFMAALEKFATPDHPVECVRAVATSAARDASNANEFASKLEGLGVQLSIIPGTREAALSFAGASCDFVGERLMVVDVGGGSTEVIVGMAGSTPERSHSFNIGCRRVTEKFLASDPPTDEELAQARTWIADGMSSYFDELRLEGLTFTRLVAVAGTATSVVSVHEHMETYDSKRVHKSVIDRAALDEVYTTLRTVPLERRRKIVGLDPGRAPVIVAGMLILQVVLDLAQADTFTVSETDILHGCILDAATHRS